MAAVPANLAAALKYGPQTQTAVRRSQYLSDALKQMQTDGGKITGGFGELGAKLLATAILQRSSRKADEATLGALKGDQNAETSRLVAALRPPAPEASSAPQIVPPAAPTPPPQPMQPAPQQAAPAPAPQAAPPAAPIPAAVPQIDPNIDAIVRTVWGEARGEDPTGQAAVAGVILNRAKERGMGPRDVVMQPGQFEPWANPETRQRMAALTPDSPEYQAILQNISPALQGQNPVGGADHFYSPQAQAALKRPPPSWDNGSGQDLGRHRFFDLEQGQPQQAAQAQPAPAQPEVQMTAGPAPQGQMQVNPSFAAGAQPFPPSAPGSSPPAAGSAAGGVPPQAPPPAAGPQPQGQTAGRITPEQVALAEKLLTDPRTHDVGVAYAMELQKKAAEAIKYDTTTTNGVPTQVDPYTGQLRVLGIPQEARSRVVSAAEAGIPAPPGTMVQIDPNGSYKVVTQPQNGQQVLSAPGQTYREAPIQGGSNDPRSATNLITNEGKLRDDYEKQIQPYVIARQGYQKVVEAAKTGNPAGDIALVFGYMKTLDPGSTVREGEQAQVANSGTIPQTVTNIYNKLITGQGALSPGQRAQFADSARQQFGVYQRTADELNERFGELSRSYGFDGKRVVREFDPIEPFTQPSNQRAPIPEAAQQSYQRRFQQGQIDQQAPVGTAKNPYQARDEATLRALDTPANRGKYVIGPDGSFGVID